MFLVIGLIVLLGAAILVPLMVGIMLWRHAATHPLAGMGAFLTLKPFLTTPLWGMLIRSYATNSYRWDYALGISLRSILPGALLTVATVVACWALLIGPARRRAWSLLGVDCLRWGNSGLLVWLTLSQRNLPFQDGLALLTTFGGLALPIVMALVAAELCQTSVPANDTNRSDSIVQR